jgi:hypothetical protein
MVCRGGACLRALANWAGATSHAGLAPNLVRSTLSPGLVYGLFSLFVNATPLGLGVGERIEEHLAGLGVVLAKGGTFVAGLGHLSLPRHRPRPAPQRHDPVLRHQKRLCRLHFLSGADCSSKGFLDKAHTEIRALVTAAARGVGAILEGGKYLVHSVVNDWRDGAVGL